MLSHKRLFEQKKVLAATNCPAKYLYPDAKSAWNANIDPVLSKNLIIGKGPISSLVFHHSQEIIENNKWFIGSYGYLPNIWAKSTLSRQLHIEICWLKTVNLSVWYLNFQQKDYYTSHKLFKYFFK